MHGRLREWAARSTDRLLASDPGLGRLRMALSSVVAMGSSLAVEQTVARIRHADAVDTLVAMLLGAVVAMIGAMALSGTGVWVKVRTAACFPVATGVGMLAGIAVGGHTDLMLIVFVVVMFGAVFVRRFGLPFFFYGFMAWMGYFLAAFLHATVGMLPAMIGAVVASSTWVLALSVTVLRTNPGRTLHRTVRAYDARARALAQACAELLATGSDEPRRRDRWRRRLLARQAGLAEAALMVEGWSEDPGALPAAWSGPALRRRLLDVAHALDRLAASTVALTGTNDDALVRAAHSVLDHIAGRRDTAADTAARRLAGRADRAEATGDSGAWAARHLAAAALEFVDLADQDDQPPQVDPVDEFAPTALLALGNLPGSPAVAQDVPARGNRWNPLARLDMTTRQAIQVAVAGGLAIVLGRHLSTTRYYWAVIAAFVAFTGTATRSETLVKAANRVVGTLAGLLAAIGLANLTAGHTTWVLVVILASMFCGFYLIRVSYAYMIFFITIMVGQLYSVLHVFTARLLVLRLEETVIGAGVGIAVALLVTPLSTRDTVRVARDSVLTALEDLLVAAATHLDRSGPGPDLDALSRTLDNRTRELALVAKPLTRPFLLGGGRSRTRHRLGLYAALAAHGRALTVGVRRHWPEDPHGAAAACRALAGVASGLTEALPGRPVPALRESLAAADTAVFLGRSTGSGARAADPVLRPLIDLCDVLTDLARTRAEIGSAPPPRPAVAA